MVVATGKKENKLELEFAKDMVAYYKQANTTLDDLFTLLELDKIGAKVNLFKKPTFRYWLRYCTLYNSEAKVEVEILPILFEYYDKERILRSFISSDSTEDLKDEMIKNGFASYIE